MNTVSEERQQIEQAKAGSTEAFTALVDRYRLGLLRFLVTRCASYADAEDALQDTLINAYRYLYSYDPQWRFSTWLYRIAIRNAAKQQGGKSSEIGEIEDPGNDPLTQCIAASERENLWLTAKRHLSDEVYTAMWLRYVEDMSVNDIAAVLERSTSWAKVNLMRGRKRLDVELNRMGTSKENEAYG